MILFQAFVPRNLEEVQSCDSATPGNDRGLLGSRWRGQTDRALCAGANQPTSGYIEERQKDRKTERHRKKRERQKGRKAERQKERQKDRKRERKKDRK